VIRFLVDHGATVAVGTSVLLAVGLLAVLMTRSALHKKRIAVATLRVWLVWLVLACVPMSRPFVTTKTESAPAMTSIETPVVSEAAAPRPTEPILAAEASETVLPEALPVTMTVDARRLLAVAFVLGAGAFLVYVLLAWLVLRRRLRAARAAPAWVTNLAGELGPEIPRLRILVLSGARPFCCGLLRPTVVVPPELLDHRERLRCVLLHELSHIAERDPHDHALVALTLPVLYWNPLFWLLRGRLRLSAELVADAIAVRRCDRSNYVKELIELATTRSTRRDRVPAVSVLGIESDFSRRMTMLLTRTKPLSTQCSRFQSLARNAAAALVLAFVTMAFGAQTLPAQQKASKPPAAKVSVELDTLWLYATADDLQLLLEQLSKGYGLVNVKLGVSTGGGRRLSARIRTTDREQAIRSLQGVSSKGRLLVSVKIKQLDQPKKSNKPPLVRFAFNETDIRKVVETISQCAGANIIMSPEVQGTITMRLMDVPWRNALEATVKTLGYVVVEEPGPILIITTPSNPLVKKRGK